MGLDISAYNRLSYLNPQPGDDEEGDLVYLHNCNGYNRLLSQAEGYYECIDNSRLHIDCGAYSRYSRWRENLARLAGWPLGEYEQYGKMYPSHCATAWEAEGGPFWELINFGDNDGSIGTAVSKKLSLDFMTYRTSIKQRAELMAEGEYFMKKYDEWREAFKLASDQGAVNFG